jgi:hypothetical protein
LCDGKASTNGSNYDKAWNDCISILEKRSACKTGKYPYGSSKTISTGYFVNGKEVLRSTPHVDKGSETAPTTNKKVGTAILQAKAADVGVGVKVTWKKVSGANGYDVYMSTSKNGTYKKVGTTPTASYTKSGLKKEKTYYFKVKVCAIASVDNNAEVNKTYSNYSKVVSYKTSKYSLNTVIDKGGDNVYFYWLWDGKSAWKDDNYNNAFDKCMDILESRHKIDDDTGAGAGAKELNYYIDNKQVVKALPGLSN